jgi:hypothetical protein
LATTRRRPFEASLLRPPGRAYMVEGERVHNVFDLQVINKRPDARSFTITVVGPQAAEVVVSTAELRLESFEMRNLPVHVFVPVADFRAGLRAELQVRCADPGGELVRTATAPLLGPSNGRR